MNARRHSHGAAPAEPVSALAPRELVPAEVSLIYVSVEGPARRPGRPVRGRGPLGAAARALHRMADHVDAVRRSLEYAADSGRL